MNGYCKNGKSWEENSRVKKIQIDYNDEPVGEVIWHDSMQSQGFRLPATIWLHLGDTIKMTIIEAYPGDKYQDTAISVLMPMGGK